MSSALLPSCPSRTSHSSFAACGGRGGGWAPILSISPRRVRCSGVFCCSNQESSPRTAVDGPGFGGDFYELLGIQRDGSFDEIKKAYKRKARKYHPDVSPPDCTGEYTQHFIVLKKAYDTLSDPRSRALYDQHLAGGLHFNEDYSPKSNETLIMEEDKGIHDVDISRYIGWYNGGGEEDSGEKLFFRGALSRKIP